MTCAVYKLQSLSGKFYIGSSKYAEKRIRTHELTAKRGVNSPSLNSAYAKYGVLQARC